jgi:hypothetical protein
MQHSTACRTARRIVQQGTGWRKVKPIQGLNVQKEAFDLRELITDELSMDAEAVLFGLID